MRFRPGTAGIRLRRRASSGCRRPVRPREFRRQPDDACARRVLGGHFGCDAEFAQDLPAGSLGVALDRLLLGFQPQARRQARLTIVPLRQLGHHQGPIAVGVQGGAGIAVVNDETAMLINPAGLGKLRDYIFTIADPEIEISGIFFCFRAWQ